MHGHWPSDNTKFLPRNALRCLPPQAVKGVSLGKAVETPLELLEETPFTAGLPTPWLGVTERVFWCAYELWFAVLALRLLSERSEAALRSPASLQAS